METVTDILFLGSKITVEVTAAVKLKDVCFLEGKLWQTQRILKIRNITLPTKVYTVKDMVLFFPAVMYKHENWIFKKAEC